MHLTSATAEEKGIMRLYKRLRFFPTFNFTGSELVWSI